jgi:hypothetical protein
LVLLLAAPLLSNAFEAPHLGERNGSEMPELARTIVSRLRSYLGNRRYAKRHAARLPCRVTPMNRPSANGSGPIPWMDGLTLDLSLTGLAIIVPAIRIGEHYLVGEDRRLFLKLDVPLGQIEMHVKPVRYESLEEHETETGYLIGLHITAMDDQHRASYDDFVNRLSTIAPPD